MSARRVMMAGGIVAAIAGLAATRHDVVRWLADIKISSGAVPKLASVGRPGWMSEYWQIGSRTLPIEIYYPRHQTPQLTGAEEKQRSASTSTAQILKGFGLRQDAEPVPAPGTFPLLVFAPGWGGGLRSNTIHCAAIAAAGYIVIAIADVGADPDAVGDAAKTFDMSSESQFEASWQLAERRLLAMSERVRRVIDAALERSTSPDWRLAGRINRDAVGVMGFSFGGSVAAEAARADRRIRAAVNLDGWLIGQTTIDGIGAPYLSFSSEFPGLAAAAESRSAGRREMARATIRDREIQRRLAKQPNSFALLLKGTQHADFTDELFAPSLLSYARAPYGLWRSGQLRVHEITMSYVSAFLDTHLKGEAKPALMYQRPSPYADVEWLGRP